MRLHAHEPENVVEAARTSFVMPTGVDDWRAYLRTIARTYALGYPMAPQLSGNLAHRFQLLEFETAILLHFRETSEAHGRSTLHVSVLSLKIHQHVLLCHAILEGIGSHLTRFHARQRNQPVNEQQQVGAPTWRAAILNACFAALDRQARNALRQELEQMTAWRDMLHLDRLTPGGALHFNVFTIADCFDPTYSVFRRIMSQLNNNWPARTCLNEDFLDP